MKSTLLALAIFIIQAATPQQLLTGSIEGVVTKAGTGDPLSGVSVVLGRSGDPISITTGADGKFVFSNLAPGFYFLSASLPGYVMTELDAQIVLPRDEQRRGIRLAMMQTGVVAGRVLDKNGEPVKRALVQAQRQVYTDGIPGIVTVQVVATNDLGEYRLFWLPPGQYFVSATLTDPALSTLPVWIAPNPTYIPTDVARTALFSATPGTPTVNPVTSRSVSGGTSEEAAVPLYYPGTANLQTASRIEVRPGSTTAGIDFTAESVRVFKIRGTVVDETTGRPIRPSNISIVQKSFLSTPPLRVQGIPTANGFEFTGIAPGSYIVEARAIVSTNPEPSTAMVAGRVAIEVADADLNNVPIVVRRPFLLNGKITLEGRSSLPDSSQKFAGRSVGQIVLRSDEGDEVPVTAFSEGSFITTVPFPGAFRVFVRNLSGFSGYVKSIRLGPEDGLYDRIHLEGPTQNTLDIVVSLNAGKLAGTVLNERQEPAQSVNVVLVPDSRFRSRPDLFLAVWTNSGGKFSIEGIAPGNYKVFAWENVASGAWFDPEFMRLQETRGIPVSFVEGSMENIELRTIPAGR